MQQRSKFVRSLTLRYATQQEQQGEDHNNDIIKQSSHRDAPETGTKLGDAR